MNFFSGVNTVEELKKAYRKLALEHHPDRGGSDETMAAINNEYEKAAARIKAGGAKDAASLDGFRDIIDPIINFDIEIEICGSWIWVSGNTFPVKKTLNEVGFKWAGRKKMWFWKPEGAKTKSKGLSMERIRELHGSEKVRTNARKGIA